MVLSRACDPAVSLSACQPVSLSAFQPVGLSACQPVGMSACRPVTVSASRPMSAWRPPDGRLSSAAEGRGRPYERDRVSKGLPEVK